MSAQLDPPNPIKRFFDDIPRLASEFEPKAGILYFRPGQMREILNRTAKCYLTFYGQALQIEPELTEWLHTKKAFEDILDKMINIFFLYHEYTPLYTLDELSQLMASFIDHHEANRCSLLQSGLAACRFGSSPWIDRQLGKLYQLPPGFAEHMANHHSNSAEQLKKVFDNAYSLRNRLFSIKTSVMKRILDALQQRTKGELLYDCIKTMA